MNLEKKKRVRQLEQFLEKCSVLLNEGYSFYDAMHMLAPHHMKDEKESLAYVQHQLKEGHTMTSLFDYFGVPSKYLLMLQIAEKRGAFAHTLQSVAAQIKRNAANKQQLLKLLSYPVTLFFLLAFLLVCFRQYFLPQMTVMFHTTSNEKTWIELSLSKLFLHIPDFFLALCILFILCITVMLSIVLKKEVGRQLQIIQKIPILNHFSKITLTKQLAEELGTLLVSGLSIQECLKMLEKQTYQPYVSFLVGRLLEPVVQGDLLSQAVKKETFLQKEFHSYVFHGEKGGNLGRELLIYGEFLAEKQQTLIQKCMRIVQPSFFLIIAVCILGAYLAILLPMYQMMDFV